MLLYNCQEGNRKTILKINQIKMKGAKNGWKVEFMTILVNGVEKELVASGKNGVEWTNDLLGNYDALHYDEDTEQYIMTEDEFEWWAPVVDMLNEINDLEQELGGEARSEYEAEDFDYADFDSEVKSRLDWLKNHAK